MEYIKLVNLHFVPMQSVCECNFPKAYQKTRLVSLREV